jgi:cbb3-type cytochrome oxidase subunit 3
MVLIVAEFTLRTGSILSGFQTYLSQSHGFQTVLPYSGKIGYSYPFLLGLLSILFSFGKGIIFYCPGLLLVGWAWKSISNPVERKLLILWFLIVLGLILVYASWWARQTRATTDRSKMKPFPLRSAAKELWWSTN